ILKLPNGTDQWVDITKDEPFKYALGLAVDRQGNVYAVDGNLNTSSSNTSRVLKLPYGGPSWVNLTDNPSSFNSAIDIAVDGIGNVYVSDVPNNITSANGRIFKLEAGGNTWTNIVPAVTPGNPPFLIYGIGVDKYDNL